ncbi:MAG: NADH-quinone oxidoreductase subunit NuoE [Stappia sp.]|uniref:NADH-quinone oxidoreductase subunit E n=1 Tax=Stappia sp. TaxID=1870903 RepID=UPI000C4F8A9C|nr:NADH-quinone oxidoreductase subunit E [Stappia sp.]MBM21736.1 NADH-quinone oxidoreductase subunit NuoE [Stappia sp.]|tara:strand:+ start:950 stop:2143 length:1194 start_codon:yes stop_codon:yes gene_type:complete
MAVRRLHHEQPESFAFTPDNQAWAEKVIGRYPEGRQASAVIPLLWRAQEQHNGWLPEPAIRCVADMLSMPHIRVLEVATFYTMFQLQPVGRKAHIQVCGTTPCQLRGAEDLVAVCKRRIAEHAHEVSEDGDFSWEEVECLGACVNAPMIQIFKDTYEDLTPEGLEGLIDDISAGREVTPGPQNGRRFGMPLSGQTSLGDIKDTTEGHLPAAHVIDGAEKASHAFAGGHINAGGSDFNGVPGKAPGAAKTSSAKKADDIGTDAQKAVPAAKPAARKAEAPAKSEPKKPAAQTSLDLDEDTGTEPELLKGAREGKADDLKRIKGVGPKIEGILNEIGVYHFDQIAGWTEENKAWVETRLKFKGRIDREDWIAQAKVLASGGETEFSQRVDTGDVPTSKA